MNIATPHIFFQLELDPVKRFSSIKKYCSDFGSENCLPVGFQVICEKNHDIQSIDIGLALEREFGKPILPDIANFLS